jgi:hypothetical protein
MRHLTAHSGYACVLAPDSATLRDDPQTTVIAAEAVDWHGVRLGRR